MNATNVGEQELESDLRDLREVPLADISLLDKDLIVSVVRRLVPEAAASTLPVASFNSAI